MKVDIGEIAQNKRERKRKRKLERAIQNVHPCIDCLVSINVHAAMTVNFHVGLTANIIEYITALCLYE